MGAMVRNTSFSIYSGQITGIFGLIGSGRTETAKIIAGVAKRDFFHGGEVLLEGEPVRYRVPRPAIKAGVAHVTEDRKIEGFLETMPIAGNIQMGLRNTCRRGRSRPCGGRGRGLPHGTAAPAPTGPAGTFAAVAASCAVETARCR